MGIVIYKQHGVAVGDQIVHHTEQPLHIGRVQTDGRFVQHIQHAGGAVAHGPCQLHPLALAGGQRGLPARSRVR